MSDNNEGEVEEQQEQQEGEEEQEKKTHAYLYLWYDYVVDYYSYDKIKQGAETYDETIASKVLMTFDAANPFLDDDQDELRAYVHPNGNNEDSEITAAGLKEAYQNAHYYVNLLNAGEMEYHVEFMFSKRANCSIESLVALDAHETIAWSLHRYIMCACCCHIITRLLLQIRRK